MPALHRGRHPALAMALLAVLIAGLVGPGRPAAAAPTAGGDEGGASPALQAALDTATRGYVDAQAKLEHSRQRQADLADQAAKVDAQLTALRADTDQIASAAYRASGLRTAAALLDSPSTDSLLDRAMMMQVLAVRDDRLLHEVIGLQKQLAAARSGIDAEVTDQQQQLDAMAKQKQQAEAALAAAGGGPASAGVPAVGPATAGPATAAAAPRRADGTWPPESCSVKDPTTTGCITPRMLNAMQQAKAAGFTHYVSCFRQESSGEHPKGRACDFAANPTGFAGVATGAERTYGNNLAAYFLANASRLGVLYVIWFKQIWSPALGWHAYKLGNGDPSSDHTNHVHLSVY